MLLWSVRYPRRSHAVTCRVASFDPQIYRNLTKTKQTTFLAVILQVFQKMQFYSQKCFSKNGFKFLKGFQIEKSKQF